MNRFDLLDITGDAGIRAFGSDPKELFSNASAGLFHLITGGSPVSGTIALEVAAEAGSLEGLLVSWLNELIFRFDTYGFLGGRVVVEELGKPSEGKGWRIRAMVFGEDFDPSKHGRGLLIKAATYHLLKIAETDGELAADIIFDV